MRQAELELMRAQVEQLERACHFWKRLVVLVALVLVGGTVLLGASDMRRPDVLEAEGFLVRDQNGKIRARLGTWEEGQSAGLVLYDAAERPRTSLGVKLGPDGRSWLAVLDERGRERATIDLTHDKSERASLKLHGQTDQDVASLSVTTDGTSGLNFTRKNVPRIRGGLGADGKSSLTISDRDGEVQFRAP